MPRDASLQGLTFRLRTRVAKICWASCLSICLGSLSLVAYSAWTSCQQEASFRLRDVVAGAAICGSVGSLRNAHRDHRPTGVICDATLLMQPLQAWSTSEHLQLKAELGDTPELRLGWQGVDGIHIFGHIIFEVKI